MLKSTSWECPRKHDIQSCRFCPQGLPFMSTSTMYLFLPRCFLSEAPNISCRSTCRLRLRRSESFVRLSPLRPWLCCEVPPEYCLSAGCPPCERHCATNIFAFFNSNFLICRSRDLASKLPSSLSESLW